MDERIAWVLNLDVESELEHGAERTRDRATEARIEALASRLGGLVAAEDRVVWPAKAPPDASGLWGRAWCPTPEALARLGESGARAPKAPAFEILRRVNDKRFGAALGQNLPNARFVEDEGALTSTLESGEKEARWLLKRAFGFAGREQRRVSSGALTDADRRWIASSFRRGVGLQVEPCVERLLDVGLHGYLDDRGTLRLGRPTVQTIDARGAWVSTEIAQSGVLRPEEARALEAEAERAARALEAAGYFGAFGVDAFRYRREGELRFQPRSEINARYSMGWAVGMAGFRPSPGLP
jgi:hypothetical protein